jgi:hypothetical protein
MPVRPVEVSPVSISAGLNGCPCGLRTCSSSIDLLTVPADSGTLYGDEINRPPYLFVDSETSFAVNRHENAKAL